MQPEALAKDLGACVNDMGRAREAGNDSRYLAADTRFHQILFDRADNRFLNDAYQTIASKMAALRNRLGNHPEHMSKSFDEHQRMVDCLKAGDVDAAEDILIKHIGRKEGSYWRLASTED